MCAPVLATTPLGQPLRHRLPGAAAEDPAGQVECERRDRGSLFSPPFRIESLQMPTRARVMTIQRDRRRGRAACLACEYEKQTQSTVANTAILLQTLGPQVRHPSRGPAQGRGQEALHQGSQDPETRHPPAPPAQAPPHCPQAPPGREGQGRGQRVRPDPRQARCRAQGREGRPAQAPRLLHAQVNLRRWENEKVKNTRVFWFLASGVDGKRLKGKAGLFGPGLAITTSFFSHHECNRAFKMEMHP
nr:uncharacterized protein CTRU02_13598 [Colletotrichum truncatum]KAF6783131.1 hypothetical protein CTRU02_13598 [Colletotrichum truncatum]